MLRCVCCCIVALLFLLQSHYIYLCICVLGSQAGRQAVDGSGGGSGACRGCYAAIASFDTEHFLFNFHASHAYPDGALPPPVSLFHSLFFLIYFRIYLYIFACLVTFYLPLSHSHFVQVISGTLLIQFWTLSFSLSLWYALLGRQNVGREGGEPLEHFLSSNFPGKAIITRLRYTLPAHATWRRIVSHRIRNANAEPRDGRLWKLPAAYLFLKFMILKLLPQEARSKKATPRH